MQKKTPAQKLAQSIPRATQPGRPKQVTPATTAMSTTQPTRSSFQWAPHHIDACPSRAGGSPARPSQATSSAKGTTSAATSTLRQRATSRPHPTAPASRSGSAQITPRLVL